MMTDVNNVLLIIFGITIIAFLWHFNERKKHPPGPLGFPILGMIPFRLVELLFSKWLPKLNDTETFQIFNKKYGPIWSIKFGRQRLVTISSWELINDAFIVHGDLFSGRPNNDLYKLLGYNRGIIMNEGEKWKENRLFAMKAMKDLGMGKHNLNEQISDEGDALVSYLAENANGKVDLLESFTKAVSNIIIYLVFHDRNDYSDESLNKYIWNLRYLTRSDVVDKKFALSPFLFQTKFMKKICTDVGKFFDANNFCFQFVKDKCLTRIKQQGEDEEPRCVFDYFYRFRSQKSSPPSSIKEDIVQIMQDLFDAGIDTSSNLLTFCCLMLGKYRSVQDDIRNEVMALRDVRGCISLAQRKNCVKLLSFIDEVQRYCCLVPRAHHRVMSTCVFHGYKLYPTDIIFADFANLFRSAEIFVDPNEFNAYRFLDESGTKYCPSKYLISFGIGKRVCLGEGIANVELFVFLTKIMTKFQIILTKETLESFDNIIRGFSGIVHGPLDHFVTLTCL